MFVVVFVFVVVFETVSLGGPQLELSGLELTGHKLIFLLPPKCWDCRPVLLYLSAVGMNLSKQVLDLYAAKSTKMIRRINESLTTWRDVVCS